MIDRREFLLQTAAGATAFLFPSASRARQVVNADGLLFRPFPHAGAPDLGFTYLTDRHEDPFKSAVSVTRDGIAVPETALESPFSVNARWYVDGFGYVWLAADNAGRFYSRETIASRGPFNLNLEFARSRVARNATVRARYERDGTEFGSEVRDLMGLSEELCNEANRRNATDERTARIADRSLRYALEAGEALELENARDAIRRFSQPKNVFIGCESRQIVWAKSEEFTKRFVELFNFATITHYVWDSWYQLFEPTEGTYNWGIKDDTLRWLLENRITPQGRPLFWFHPTVTPEWLKQKSYDALKVYVEKHTHDLVTHYGDRVLAWEVVNEYHDWANIFNHTPEQITEIVRLACDRTKAENPKVVRILNNCCPWGEYVARGRMARMEGTRPLRTVRKYLADLQDAGVEYDVLGIQIYFPQRDLSDIARLLERLSVFGKPVYITEIGASSNMHAPNPSGAVNTANEEPFSWHREWDEELQADWLEQVYTLYYSKPYIKAINWYDFSDFRPFIVNGGLVKEDCTPKASFRRLQELLHEWHITPPGLEKQ